MKSQLSDIDGLSGWFDTLTSVGTEYLQFEKEKKLSKLRIQAAEQEALVASQQAKLLEQMKASGSGFSQILPAILIASAAIGGVYIITRKRKR